MKMKCGDLEKKQKSCEIDELEQCINDLKVDIHKLRVFARDKATVAFYSAENRFDVGVEWQRQEIIDLGEWIETNSSMMGAIEDENEKKLLADRIKKCKEKQNEYRKNIENIQKLLDSGVVPDDSSPQGSN